MERKINKFYDAEKSELITLDAMKLYIKPCPVNPTVVEANFFLSAV